ncbi:hypothetical protein KFK09_011398 [Dendrobium nobile]|uniref:Uncharacterized protein n=1 Tax=Dendrobium nobile TaxID=94219 RepID=A0A8T3BCI6_DENNO|nr:hypothetical protein KFK09_011398 [Dendrobium nobile]
MQRHSVQTSAKHNLFSCSSTKGNLLACSSAKGNLGKLQFVFSVSCSLSSR